MSTALDIINRALRILCVSATGQSVGGQEGNDALYCLNTILGQWNNEKLMIYYTLNEVFNLVGGTGTYTIGATGAFVTTRPVKIDSAFVRDSSSGSNNDFPLEIIPNNKYEDLCLKSSSTTYPQYLNYVPTFPNGQIRIWPVPTTSLQISISQWKQFTKFTLISDTVSLPEGYETALAYNLEYELSH
jgi:hypothetical protein